MDQRILYETHSHTPLCKHAVGTPEEYAAAAAERGLLGIVVTCHNPMPDGFSSHVRMSEHEFDQYVDLVARARDVWSGRVDVRLGLEADYFAGYESWLERQIESAQLHYVLGSVHPQIAEFRQRYATGDRRELQRTYFRLLADAAETGLFDCLAHPDLIKNETVDAWEPAQIMPAVQQALDRIAATGIAMELNTSGVNKVIPEMNPFPEMLVEMRQREIPVVVGADAHAPARVGDGFEAALDLLVKSGYSHINIFLERQRRELPISAVRESLAAPQGVNS